MTETRTDIARGAAWIAGRRLARRDIADMPADLKPVDEAGGYAMQAALRDLLKYHAPHALAGADSRAAQAAWDRAVKAIS